MLIEESLWVKNILLKHFKVDSFPMLNIGSSTEDFRKNVQPHLNTNIFEPLVQENKKVYHCDLKADEGVDLVGDLNNRSFLKSLESKNIKSVLCSNLLEHLENPQLICDSILKLLNRDGLIIVTVPYHYSYHKDPIDTKLRPNIQELHKFFPNTEILASEIVQSDQSLMQVFRQNKKYCLVIILRWLMPFYKFNDWKYMIKDIFLLNKAYSATCLLLRKTE